ncbi:MAG: formate--phosphoribosylaminoimidazolecarboxamide ligase [Candidatus Nezhaarchaeota archaeon]|nr:formate--phosphoribosylaminoimidazolecarboxamide ligase [Candidatus Nezhaarchaeota archaeon]MCX8141391.1 formate--phosphoribosylaminoimidazolecarboxamide ligase [Candidatus Nezhaarchaeota archaeon]MDW8049657.1 formate--phosphoribosylaminoimidazolecarboxamide ligase [Nitrososphaerota archaeon]
MNSSKITIVTLGSHSALQILKGAKDEGLKTALVCLKRRVNLYRRFSKLIDEMILVDSFFDVTSTEVQKKLLSLNAILIPHGSLIEYVDLETIEQRFEVPIFGNKYILRWEADRDLKEKLLREAGARTPRAYKSIDEVDRTVIVKLPGAKGGRGYFLASGPDDVRAKIKVMKLNEGDVFIQEYIVGVTAYAHFFYSPLTRELELFGVDRRYETNADGLGRLPASIQLASSPELSYLVVGNIPIVLRESLLEEIYEIGDGLVRASEKLVPPGLIGPFCIEGAYDGNGNFYVFEFSARIVAGTNLYVNGSPYTWFLYDEPMSMGRRIAREIKRASERGELDKLLT